MECEHIYSKTRISTDAPLDNKGDASSFSPTDLVATSLASCVLTIYAIYTERHGLDMKGSYAEVEKIMQDNPRKITQLNLDLFLPIKLKEKGEELWLRMAQTCPVHRSLDPAIQQDIRIHFV